MRLLDTLSGTAQKVVCDPKNTQYLLDQRNEAKFFYSPNNVPKRAISHHLKDCKYWRTDPSQRCNRAMLM